MNFNLQTIKCEFFITIRTRIWHIQYNLYHYSPWQIHNTKNETTHITVTSYYSKPHYWFMMPKTHKPKEIHIFTYNYMTLKNRYYAIRYASFDPNIITCKKKKKKDSVTKGKVKNTYVKLVYAFATMLSPPLKFLQPWLDKSNKNKAVKKS